MLCAIACHSFSVIRCLPARMHSARALVCVIETHGLPPCTETSLPLEDCASYLSTQKPCWPSAADAGTGIMPDGQVTGANPAAYTVPPATRLPWLGNVGNPCTG